MQCANVINLDCNNLHLVTYFKKLCINNSHKLKISFNVGCGPRWLSG